MFIYMFEREGKVLEVLGMYIGMEKCGSWQGQKWKRTRVGVDDVVVVLCVLVWVWKPVGVFLSNSLHVILIF